MGTMPLEVLAWLQKDELFEPASAAYKAVAPDYKATRSDVKSEEGRKFIMSGHLGASCDSGACCTLSLANPLPLPRFQQWFRAFRTANQVAWDGGSSYVLYGNGFSRTDAVLWVGRR